MRGVGYQSTTHSKISSRDVLCHIIDALDECLSPEESERLATLFMETLPVPDLLIIHLIFTSRPEAHICAAMPPGVCQISFTTRDADIVQDCRFFLRALLDDIRTSRSVGFERPKNPRRQRLNSRPWPLRQAVFLSMLLWHQFFITRRSIHPAEARSILLREKSNVGADVD